MKWLRQDHLQKCYAVLMRCELENWNRNWMAKNVSRVPEIKSVDSFCQWELLCSFSVVCWIVWIDGNSHYDLGLAFALK